VGQIRDTLDNNKTVWEEVSGGLDILKIGDYEIASRAYIGRFNFKGQDQQKRVGRCQVVSVTVYNLPRSCKWAQT
jgi:ATPase subunit of ABC transporter with duplicated ATPase domains